MAKAGRVIVAVLAGAAAWAVLWNLGTRAAQAALPDLLAPDVPVTHTGILIAYIGWSVALSLLAGYITAVVAGTGAMRAVWILAVLQLALGAVFEESYWSLLPVWYHLIFLALLVPATVYGGNVGARRRAVSIRRA